MKNLPTYPQTVKCAFCCETIPTGANVDYSVTYLVDGELIRTCSGDCGERLGYAWDVTLRIYEPVEETVIGDLTHQDSPTVDFSTGLDSLDIPTEKMNPRAFWAQIDGLEVFATGCLDTADATTRTTRACNGLFATPYSDVPSTLGWQYFDASGRPTWPSDAFGAPADTSADSGPVFTGYAGIISCDVCEAILPNATAKMFYTVSQETFCVCSLDCGRAIGSRLLPQATDTYAEYETYLESTPSLATVPCYAGLHKTIETYMDDSLTSFFLIASASSCLFFLCGLIYILFVGMGA